ncbi:hypothetical protein KC367_g208 [Hortaea werneckii]|nr:hypothetical protein KC367_g208 [Hortaea werneckii]
MVDTVVKLPTLVNYLPGKGKRPAARLPTRSSRASSVLSSSSGRTQHSADRVAQHELYLYANKTTLVQPTIFLLLHHLFLKRAGPRRHPFTSTAGSSTLQTQAPAPSNPGHCVSTVRFYRIVCSSGVGSSGGPLGV